MACQLAVSLFWSRLFAAPLLAGCGSSSGESDATVPAATVPQVATSEAAATGGGGISGALTAAAEGIDNADAAACDANRATLETASLAYLTMNGSPPASQNDLVPTVLVEVVPQYEIAADGTVQPLAGGSCVGH